MAKLGQIRKDLKVHILHSNGRSLCGNGPKPRPVSKGIATCERCLHIN